MDGDHTELVAAGPLTFGSKMRCCEPRVHLEVVASRGSRRRRLWELGSHAHSPVIGVCLPLAALRRVARKVLGGEPVADDYALHCSVVAGSKPRAVAHLLTRVARRVGSAPARYGHAPRWYAAP
jgi:hypothetical protein